MEMCCPHCHQPFAVMRVGVRLPTKKARIFDLIKSAGEIGITTAELKLAVYGERKMNPVTVRAHIQQINDLLVATDWRIRSIDHRYWVLVRLPRRRKSKSQEAVVPQASEG